MKKVRLCPNCNFCNHPKLRRCEHCNTEIDLINSEIILVENHLEFLVESAPNVIEKEKPPISVPPLIDNLAKQCPNCGNKSYTKDLFCDECGSPFDGSYVTKSNDVILRLYDGSVIKLDFTQPFIYFGRKHTDNHHFSSNRYLSGLHFVLLKINDKYYIQDVSTNGTVLNGVALERGKIYSIKVNDIIKLDQLLVTVEHLCV